MLTALLTLALLAPPSTTEVIHLSPGGDGSVLTEDWTDSTLSQWNADPVNRWLDGKWSFQPTDAALGGARMRLGVLDTAVGAQTSLATLSTRLFFDHRQPILVRYKFRENFISDGESFPQTGISNFYAGEPHYDGLWHTAGDYGLHAPVGTPLFAPISSGDVVAIDMQWDPVSGHVRWRHATSGAWLEERSASLGNGVPLAIMWQGPWDYGALDLGPVKVWGSPLFGCIDYLGWYRGTFTNAAYYDGFDDSHVFGGLTGKPTSSTSRFVGYNTPAAGNAPTQDWSWQEASLSRLEPGYRHSKLYLLPYNATTNGSLLVHVRDASGALLPDSQVPGNSTGIVSTATTATGFSAGMVYVDLAIPNGKAVYVEVVGHTNGPVDYKAQPTLKAWMIEPAAIGSIPLTIDAGPVSAGAVTVSGWRASGATVALSAPGASAGAVSYPDATTWQATVSSLPAGTTTITASSGAQSASMGVTTLSGFPVKNRAGQAGTLRDRAGNAVGIKSR